MAASHSKKDGERGFALKRWLGVRGHDFVTLGIALAAIILFVGTAGVVLPNIVKAWSGQAAPPDVVLTNALLLNIALILLGWHRYKALSAELVTRKKSEEEALRLADIDHLTGCYNRRSFTATLGTKLVEVDRRETALAAIAIDLDNFKQINDLHGHQAGDLVLRSAAARIQRLLPDGGILARLGGDEFICVVPYHPQVPDRIDQLATRMIEHVARPVEDEGNALDVTISIGISTSLHLDEMRSGTTSAQKLMHKADIAMYYAKKQGKNRFYWFEAPMENELRFRNDLETGIRKGISRGEFRPYYEQQVDLETGKLVGFEMLARWESPEMGLVGPDIFIPIAEEIGVISEMSERLMAQAFEDAKKWDSELTLSVNISPVQMRDPWFAQKLLKLLVQHNFPANRLDIEITETCLVLDPVIAERSLAVIRGFGVKISLDDFGTGYASIGFLRQFRFEKLKLDRSLVVQAGEDDGSRAMMLSSITVARAMKMGVTAEGVETEEQADMVRAAGCDQIQGWLYFKAMPAEEIAQHLGKPVGLPTIDNIKDSKVA